MSVQPVEPTPTNPAPPADPSASAAPTAPAPAEPAAAAPEAPPWGDDFDAEKAWKLVQNLRSDKDKLASRPVLTDEQKTRLAEYDKVLESQKTAEQRAQEAAAAAEKRVESLVTRAVQAEVKALASTGFADPEDASAFLDLKKYATADGDVDTAAITADLADLLARKPHLGKSPATTPGMKPNPAQGSSAHPPLGLDAQIAAATQSGDIQLAIALKQQQRAASTK